MTIDRRLFTKVEPIFEENVITLGQTYGGTLINSVKAGYEYLRAVGGGTLMVPYDQYSQDDLDPTYGYFLSSWSSQASQHHSFRILGIPNGSGELPEFVMPYPLGRPAAFQFGIPGDSPQTFTSVLRVEKIRTDGFWNGCFDVRARKLAIIDCDLQGPLPADYIGPYPTYGATTRSGVTFAQTHHRSDHKDHATIFILIGSRLDNWGDYGNQKHHCYISGATRQENSLFVYLDNTFTNAHGSHSIKSPGCGTIICAGNSIDTAGGSQAFDALNWTKKVYFQDNTVYLGSASGSGYIPPTATQAWVKHWHPDLGGGHYVALSYPTYGNPDTEDPWYAWDWQALRDVDGDGSSYLNNVQCFTNNTFIVRHQNSPNPAGVMHYHTMAPMSRTNYSEDYGYALPLGDRDWHDPGIIAYGNNTLSGARSSVVWITPRWDAINYGTYPEIWNEPVRLDLGGNNTTAVELPAWARFDPDTEPTYLRFRGELDELYNLPSDTTAPGVVSNIAHGTATATSIPLTWDNPTDDAFFITVVRMSATGYPADHEDGIPVYIGPNDEWTVGRLEHDTQYYFTFFTRSRSCNYSAGVQFTASTAVKAGDTTPPSPVSNLSVVSSASNVLTLTWENPADVTRVVVRNCAAGYPGSRWADTLVYDGPGETVNHIYRITNQSTDYYSIWAADANDNWSTVVRITANARVLPATGFSIEVAGTTASLTWTNPSQSDFSFVQVLRSTTAFPSYNGQAGVSLVYQGTNTSYDDVGLTDDTTYYYTVLAFNSRSMASTTKATATAILGTGEGDTTPPGIVANIQSSVGDTSIGFVWTNPTDADFSGTVVRRGTLTFPATHTDGTGVFDDDLNNFTDSGLTADTEYRYSFFTRDTSGNYSARVEYGVRTAIDDTDVGPPGQVVITDYIINDTTLYFYWTDPDDEDLDNIKMRFSTTGFPATTISGSPGGSFNPGDGLLGAGPASLTPGTRYYVSFFAVDESGNVSPPTQIDLVTTGGSFDPTPPGPATNIDHLATTNSILLSWTNPTDGDFQEVIVRYSTDTYPVLSTQGEYAYAGTAESVDLSGLAPGTPHYFSLFSKDDSGNISEAVQYIAATESVVDTIPPDQVTGVVATPGRTEVSFSWASPPNSDFESVVVRRGTTSFPATPDDGEDAHSDWQPHFVDTELTPDTTYRYSFFSKDTTGNTSDPVHVTVKTLYPGAYVVYSDSGVHIKWSADAQLILKP